MRDGQPWLMGPAGDRSAGMLPSPHNGMTSPVVASGIRARDRVALTMSPKGAHRTRPVRRSLSCCFDRERGGHRNAALSMARRVGRVFRPLLSAALIGPGPIVTAL